LDLDLRFDQAGLVGIGGCHHDMMSILENSGLIEFRDKVMSAGGNQKK